MGKVDAVIFDLDGTLLDTLEDIADSCNESLSELGMPSRGIDEVRSFVGNGLGVLMERAVPGGKTNPLFREALSLMHRNYARNSRNKTRPYDGVLDLISALNERGIKTGIVSNKPDAQVKELAGIYFKGLINPEDAAGENEAAGIKRKPAPDSVLAVMRSLGVSADRCVYVGDSDVDIQTARNSGLPCISVCWGFRTREFLEEHGATVLVSKPEDIMDILLA